MKNLTYLIFFAAVSLGCSVDALDSNDNYDPVDAKAKKGQDQAVVASEYEGPGQAEFRKNNNNSVSQGYILVSNDCDNLYVEIVPAGDLPDGVHLGLFQGDLFPKENGTESDLDAYDYQPTYTFSLDDFDTSQELRIFSKAWGTFAGMETWGKASYFTYTFEDVVCEVVCTYGKGFWKNHSNQNPGKQENLWPVNSLNLGSVTYSQEDLNEIYDVPNNEGNNLVIFSHHLIAAKLNVANGAGNSEIEKTIEEADNYIGDLVVLRDSFPADSKETINAIKGKLEAFNESNPCEDDELEDSEES